MGEARAKGLALVTRNLRVLCVASGRPPGWGSTPFTGCRYLSSIYRGHKVPAYIEMASGHS